MCKGGLKLETNLDVDNDVLGPEPANEFVFADADRNSKLDAPIFRFQTTTFKDFANQIQAKSLLLQALNKYLPICDYKSSCDTLAFILMARLLNHKKRLKFRFGICSYAILFVHKLAVM